MAGLAPDVGDQVAAVDMVVGILDGADLERVLVGEHVDQRLLVGPVTLHGLAEGVGIGRRVPGNLLRGAVAQRRRRRGGSRCRIAGGELRRAAEEARRKEPRTAGEAAGRSPAEAVVLGRSPAGVAVAGWP